MICFRDMTYCRSETCTNYDCRRHHLTERRDRERFNGDKFLYETIPTAWSDFEHDCPDYQPPEAA